MTGNCHARFGAGEKGAITSNPYLSPYLDSQTTESKVERKEKRFLRQLLQYLSVGGIFVYNIPRGRMTKDIINILVANLDDIQIYQSHDNTYHQVYTFGRKRGYHYLDRNEVQRILSLMKQGSLLERLPLLDEPIYKVNSGTATPKLFRSRNMDVDQLRDVLVESTLTRKGMEWTTPKKPSERRQPLLPDKEMHRVLRMASGKLNGKIGRGSRLHVLKGIVRKVIVESVEETEVESITTEREVYKIIFKMVDRFGNIREIHG
ncbi:DUF6094 domain-containing protein [Bacillus cereus]|uniref:DUF6094 domain-containing protein n=1 Tax=Paenibacillus TaxID=44249 RepID=UPI0021C4C4F0|nr:MULTISPECIES: DUF6094 domain-containing protein [Paenibacillus]MEB9895711.1 DUF6094 domain-containing protein [Bacillus cereus]